MLIKLKAMQMLNIADMVTLPVPIKAMADLGNLLPKKISSRKPKNGNAGRRASSMFF
ncbi:hypothetical protein D3C79_1106120 [compost metagenome]